MTTGFVCLICGKHHEGYTTDWAYKLPDEVWAIPESERSEQARFNIAQQLVAVGVWKPKAAIGHSREIIVS